MQEAQTRRLSWIMPRQSVHKWVSDRKAAMHRQSIQQMKRPKAAIKTVQCPIILLKSKDAYNCSMYMQEAVLKNTIELNSYGKSILKYLKK